MSQDPRQGHLVDGRVAERLSDLVQFLAQAIGLLGLFPEQAPSAKRAPGHGRDAQPLAHVQRAINPRVQVHRRKRHFIGDQGKAQP